MSTAKPRRPAAKAARPPLTVWVFMAASWLLGWWMAFDGLHQRLWGDYIRLNGQLGPWADLAHSAGVDPQSLSFIFVAVGTGLLGASFGLFFRRRWGFATSLMLLAPGLLYLGFGAPLAMLCIAMLLLPATRRYLVPPLA